MFSEQWSRVISASVTPVVVISATALLCLAFYNRMAAIVARLRAVQRERLQAQDRLDTLSAPAVERGSALRESCILEGLADQSARIRKRARLIRATLMLLLSAIAALVISSLLSGLTIVWRGGMYGAAVFFALGMTLLLSAICCALAEMMIALDPAEIEIDMVSELTGDGAEPRAAEAPANRRPHSSALRTQGRLDLESRPHAC